MKLPKDIKSKIDKNYSNQSQKDVIIEFIEKIYSQRWNVGNDQLCRSILFLMNGKSSKMADFENIEDPRDIIMEAEREAGNPNHYFLKPFE
jgi:hypothetical protein